MAMHYSFHGGSEVKKPHPQSHTGPLSQAPFASSRRQVAKDLSPLFPPLSTFYLICSGMPWRAGHQCPLWWTQLWGKGPWTVSARGAPAVHSQRLTARTSACLQGTSRLVSRLYACLCLRASPWRREGLTILVPLPATEKREA